MQAPPPEKAQAAAGTATAQNQNHQMGLYPNPNPASSSVCRSAWLDRAAIVLAGVLVNLTEAVHLDPAEREAGWGVFEELLDRYVTAKRQGTADA
jgi:hypothetical protein